MLSEASLWQEREDRRYHVPKSTQKLGRAESPALSSSEHPPRFTAKVSAMERVVEGTHVLPVVMLTTC